MYWITSHHDKTWAACIIIDMQCIIILPYCWVIFRQNMVTATTTFVPGLYVYMNSMLWASLSSRLFEQEGRGYVLFLTHWGRVTHICVSKFTIIGSDNGLSPGRRQAIIWTNAGILLIGPLGTNFNVILIEIQTFLFMKMRLKVSSAKWRPFCLGLKILFSTRQIEVKFKGMVLA